MSFMKCELRCHILDRQDQLESCKQSRVYHEKKIKELLEACDKAKLEYETYLEYVAKRESFIALVESTLDKQWIDRPDLLEKEWGNETNRSNE